MIIGVYWCFHMERQIILSLIKACLVLLQIYVAHVCLSVVAIMYANVITIVQ